MIVAKKKQKQPKKPTFPISRGPQGPKHPKILLGKTSITLTKIKFTLHIKIKHDFMRKKLNKA